MASVARTRVAEEIVAHDGHLAVVAPFLGIAHVVGDGVQLDDGRLLGGLGHPRKRLDVAAQGLFERLHQLRDLGLGVGAEGRLDVLLPQQIAERAVHRGGAAVGARARLLDARRGSAARNRNSRSQTLPATPRRPRAAGGRRSTPEKRSIGWDGSVAAICFRKSGWATFRRLERRRAHGLEITVPVEARGERRQLLPGHDVVGLVGIAQGHAVHGRLGEDGLHLENHARLGGGGVGGVAGKLEHVLHVLLEALADLDGLGVGLQVVLAVGQREAALAERGDGAVGILGVRGRAEQEQRADAQTVQVGDLGHHVRLIAHRLDAVQLGLDGRDALLVDGRGVHATGEVVADLLVDRAAAGLHHGGALQDVELHLFVAVLQFGETSPAGAVGGERVLGDPVAAGVLVEVDARIDGLVHGGGVDARLAPWRARAAEGKRWRFEVS